MGGPAGFFERAYCPGSAFYLITEGFQKVTGHRFEHGPVVSGHLFAPLSLIRSDDLGSRVGGGLMRPDYELKLNVVFEGLKKSGVSG